MFDTEEYLHLAIHASSVGDHHACISYLREILWEEPRNAKAIYLLAIQHAEIGMFERAIDGLNTALTIDSRLETGRFQLGLLLVAQNRRSEAKQHFVSLLSAADSEMRSYSEAMIAFADDEPIHAREKLNSGLATRCSKSALANLMRWFLEKLEKEDDFRTPAASTHETEVFLGAYAHTT